MTTSLKQTIIDLIAEETPWYMHIAIWCYIYSTVLLMLLLPAMFGIMLQQNGLDWEVVPNWAGNLYSHTGWMVEFLAGYSIIDIVQRGSRYAHERWFEKKDVL